jgi:hypothetical protein
MEQLWELLLLRRGEKVDQMSMLVLAPASKSGWPRFVGKIVRPYPTPFTNLAMNIRSVAFVGNVTPSYGVGLPTVERQELGRTLRRIGVRMGCASVGREPRMFAAR